MKCKNCGAEIDEGVKVCPFCQASCEEEPEQAAAEEAKQEATAEEVTSEEESAEETATAETSSGEETAQTEGEETSAETSDETDESAGEPKPKMKKTTLWAIIAAAVVAVVAVVLVVISAMKPVIVAHEVTIDNAAYTSYTATAEQLTDKVSTQIVATCGNDKLTNSDLGYYYWQQYYSLVNSYGMYLSYMMDTTKPLDEQIYEDNTTWQQMLLDSSLNLYHQVAAFYQAAQEDGYTLDEDTESYLEMLSDNLEEAAANNGYDSAEAYLQASFGPKATLEGYENYLRKYITASKYLNSLVDAEEYTDDDLSNYYDENAESYQQSGLNKIDKPNVNMRHILIAPTETNEDGTYTDAAWADAEKQAQAVLDEWLAGDKTEDSFAELANSKSADSGSNTNGGLYEDVYPGQMTTEINDWCFADGRQVGDYDIVKTDYGYHVIYFSGTTDSVYWKETVRDDYLNSLSEKISQQITDKYTWEETLENAAIFDVLTAQSEAEQTAETAETADSTETTDTAADASAEEATTQESSSAG